MEKFWDKVDFTGKFSSSGVYLYRLEVRGAKTKVLYVGTKTMVLIK